MSIDKTLIITTINEKTKAISAFEKQLEGWNIILIGDKKSKLIEDSDNVKFLSINDQQKLDFSVTAHLPYNHYVRKNIGYLYALHQNTHLIYDTDDDNLPYEDWMFPKFNDVSYETISKTKYFNVYSAFTDEKIWPRGYPLTYLSKKNEYKSNSQQNSIAVWQGLADLDPDVDAIHRLIFNKNIRFNKREPLVLDRGVYCPFNSQNTLWNRDMLPYAYLPTTVTFRFTDILRGYVAQRCFWEHGKNLGFTSATVYQERNEHNLLKDFESEIPCYTQIEKMVVILDKLNLRDDYEFNLLSIYEALANEQIVDKKELDIVRAWIKDINKFL